MTAAGIALIIVGFGLFIAEIFTGHRMLAAGGAAALLLGSLVLLGRPLPVLDAWLGAITIVLVAAFIAFAVERTVRAHRRRVSAGREDLIGRTGVARTPLTPEGMVLVYGELWSAISEDGLVEKGQEVVVKRIEGLKLYVSKK